MRVLLDENLSYELRHDLVHHEVCTVQSMGWFGLRNCAVNAIAEIAGIEAFVTGDRNPAYQQSLAERRMAIGTLSAHHWPIIKDHVETTAKAVDAAKPWITSVCPMR